MARKKVVQHLVYFVSSLLQVARLRYCGVQKLIFGLIMASRKLHHYSSQPVGPPPPAGPMDPGYEAGAPAAEEVPLVLVTEPQAPTWARHIVHFLQAKELPSDQDEAERVAPRASMYPFINNTHYKKNTLP